jgi:hypothetical protein
MQARWVHYCSLYDCLHCEEPGQRNSHPAQDLVTEGILVSPRMMADHMPDYLTAVLRRMARLRGPPYFGSSGPANPHAASQEARPSSPACAAAPFCRHIQTAAVYHLTAWGVPPLARLCILQRLPDVHECSMGLWLRTAV